MKAAILILSLGALTPTVHAQITDFQAVSVRSSHSHWAPMHRVQLSSTIKNASQQTWSGVECAFYLSRDDKFSSDDKQLATFRMMSLRPGRFGTQSVHINTPIDIRSGRYHVILFVDYKKRTREIRETNNIATVAITGSPRVDFDIITSRVVGPAKAGEDMKIAYEIKNLGGTTASMVRTGFYLSSDAKITDKDHFLGSSVVGFFSPGSTVRRTATVRLPSFLSGRTFLGVVADYTGSHKESQEDNNHRVTVLTIDPPDSNLSRLELQTIPVTGVFQLNSIVVDGAKGGYGLLTLTAPRQAGRPYIQLLSRKSLFEVDDLTMLSFTNLHTNYFHNWLGVMNDKGRAYTQVVVPAGAGKLTGYVHAFFNGSLAETVDRPVKVTVR